MTSPSPPTPPDAALLRGERAEVSRALNDVESTLPDAGQRTRERLARLGASNAFARAHTVGITGPPGVGKSTLAAVLVRFLRAAGRTVGVLAVDPSSVRSGGALLGDRVRMSLDPADEGVFVRSLATGGELGGLARSVPLGVLVLSAAFDVVLVETVGIGQSETEVRHVVDTLLFVVQPGSGDSVQFLKAGIMEVPDIFVVNKADQSQAEATARELRASLASLRAAGVTAGELPVLTTSATAGGGIDQLVQALDARRAALEAVGELESRRLEGTAAWALTAFARRYGEVGLARRGGREAVRREIRDRLEAGADVLGILSKLDPFAGVLG
jgi:LAO/AO transport system kinase